MIVIPASLRSDFIHMAGMTIHIALESTIHIVGIRTQLPEPILAPPTVQHYSPTQVQPDNEAVIVQRLRATDEKPNECHGCGGKDQLLAYPLALAKTLNVKRDWTGTAASVALSAVSIPLTGFGIFRTPGKHTTYRAVRMTLILCRNCRKRRVNYELHPWWRDLHSLGYAQFLDRYDLEH